MEAAILICKTRLTLLGNSACPGLGRCQRSSPALGPRPQGEGHALAWAVLREGRHPPSMAAFWKLPGQPAAASIGPAPSQPPGLLGASSEVPGLQTCASGGRVDVRLGPGSQGCSTRRPRAWSSTRGRLADSSSLRPVLVPAVLETDRVPIRPCHQVTALGAPGR